MADSPQRNGPWSQFVALENISWRELTHQIRIELNDRIPVTPFLVPYRQDFPEVVGFRMDGPNRSVLIIPDIDRWEEWEGSGTRIEERRKTKSSR